MKVTGKRLVRIFVICIVFGILLFAFLLYASIKTKTKDISRKAPFVEFLNKPLTFERKVWLFEEKLTVNKQYPIVALDSLHPYWQWFDDRAKLNDPDVKLIKVIPAGAQVVFEKTIMYTNGVSGSSYPRMFGKLQAEGNAYAIMYTWGTESMAKFLEGEKKSWRFDLAPWQIAVDTNFYELPIADFW